MSFYTHTPPVPVRLLTSVWYVSPGLIFDRRTFHTHCTGEASLRRVSYLVCRTRSDLSLNVFPHTLHR